MALIDLIKAHTLVTAQAGNWEAVASALNLQSLPTDGVRVTGKQTILGLASLGRDPDAIRLVLEDTPSGRGLLDLLPNAGVNWVDPLTLAVLAKNTGDGKLTADDVNVLKSLSFRIDSLASRAGLGYVTADECQSAWVADTARLALEVLRQRRQTWDTLSAQIRAQIEAGSLADNAAVISAVTIGLGE